MAGDSQIKRYTRSGVPVFSLPSSDDACYAGITFRVGQDDEPPQKSGFTHLIEHVVGEFAPEPGLRTGATTGLRFT